MEQTAERARRDYCTDASLIDSGKGQIVAVCIILT